jgi:hypothetical protein
MMFFKTVILLLVLLFSFTACHQKYKEDAKIQKQEEVSKHFYQVGNGKELIRHRREIEGLDH